MTQNVAGKDEHLLLQNIVVRKSTNNKLPLLYNLVKQLETFKEYKVSLNLIDSQVSSSLKEPYLYVNDFKKGFSLNYSMDYINSRELEQAGSECLSKN